MAEIKSRVVHIDKPPAAIDLNAENAPEGPMESADLAPAVSENAAEMDISSPPP
jgi:hypothetical protein